jgi:hypothetical protein
MIAKTVREIKQSSTMTSKALFRDFMRESKLRSVRLEPVYRGEDYFTYIERRVSKQPTTS